MPKVRVHNLAMSLDGYAAGPNQCLDNPLGIDGSRLHEWVFATPAPASRCKASTAVRRASTTSSWPGATPGSAPRSWGATCSARSADRGRRQVVGLVGRQPAVPPSGLRPHPPPASTHRHGGRDHVPLRRRRRDLGARASDRRRERRRRQDRRGPGHRPAVPPRPPHRRSPRCDRPHPARPGERLFDHLGGGPEGYECVEFVSSPSVAHVRFARMPT
jgi:hypothetical protein